MKKPVYQVAVQENLVDLERVVNDAVEQGYGPIGWVFYHNGEYIQAMVLVLPHNTLIVPWVEYHPGTWLPISKNTEESM